MMTKGRLVTYECTQDSFDWGKKGAINKLFIPEDMFSMKVAKDYAPSNWIIKSIEEKERDM